MLFQRFFKVEQGARPNTGVIAVIGNGPRLYEFAAAGAMHAKNRLTEAAQKVRIRAFLFSLGAWLRERRNSAGGSF
jgi:hypothetical protein